MNRPNIFKYATKELSQDAMICWLLECLNSENEEYRQLGLNFVRFIFNDNAIKEAKLFNNSSPKTQHEKIDVYAEIVIDDTVHPIIFEDKTNTYLHDDQMYKYIKKINTEANTKAKKKYFGEFKLGDILYVYFKTGFASEWERRDIKGKQDNIQNVIHNKESKTNDIINIKFREIYLEDITDSFLGKKSYADELLSDYRLHLEHIKDIQKQAKGNYKISTESCNKALKESNEQITVLLLEDIFGEGCWIEYTPHQHRGIVYPFYTISTKHQGKDEYRIFYNFGITCYKDNYYFRLKQWRKESKCKNDLDTKIKDAIKIREICQNICTKTDHKGIKITFNNDLKQTVSKSFDSQEIFRINLKDNYSANIIDICSFLKNFIKKLNGKVESDLNATLLIVNNEKDWENK